MGKPHTEEEWVEEIAQQVDEELQKFTANKQFKDALQEILEEVYYHGGAAALNEVGEHAIEIIEHNRHPKTGRMRNRARSILMREFDADLPAHCPLNKGSLG